MLKTRLVVLMVLLAAVVVAPVQATGPWLWANQLDSMDNIAGRPWTDWRDPAEGTGWLMQNNVTMSEGTGSMEIDYGVTNDSLGVPDPTSGYDYQGNWVGVGAKGGAFDAAGNYLGKFDREIAGTFTPGNGPGEMPTLIPGYHVFVLDVYKAPVAAGFESPGHVRELQLYDSLGVRNTYQVQSEPTARFTPAGWKTYLVDLLQPFENNADLSDIQEIRLWVSEWSAYVSTPQPLPGTGGCLWPQWPDDYTLVRPVGLSVLIDDLRLIPEPATILLLGLGGLVLRRRKRV